MTVIAIDGPAGSGKSTIARALAERLGVPHVDTGAYYRALTLAVLEDGIDPTDAPAVAELAETLAVVRSGDRTLLDGRDVEAEIRGDAVNADVSAVARHPRVRRALVALQRAAVGPRGAVVEGRDAASVIVPDATLKVWLTARPEVRAARRARQQGTTGAAAVARISGELRARDHADRGYTFRDEDAVVVDTSQAAPDEIVDAIIRMLPADVAR